MGTVLRWTAIAVAAVLGAAIVLVAAIGIALDTGHLRKPLLSFIVSRAARPVAISGPLEIKVLSLHPYAIAEGVAVGNPHWMPAGTTADIGKLTLVFALPWFGRPFGIETLEMQSASLHLARLASGHANWQWAPPGTPKERPMAIIRTLTANDVKVELDDDRRHLQFHGTVSVHEVDGVGALRPLRIEAEGVLNGRGATVHIDGDPLASASHAKPYGFTYTESSSGSTLTGHGILPAPFDFSLLDTEFKASGADLKDLYFLTGVSLLNTGAYRLSGKLARQGRRTVFSELAIASGQSDASGTVVIETTGGRPNFDADLSSRVLRLADLGLRAAGRQTEAGPTLLLSNASFHPAAVRHGDGVFNFHARQVELGGHTLQSFAAKLTVNQGIVVVAPLTADVLGGKMAAHARINALTDDPVSELDLTINGLQLGELARHENASPAVEGPMRIRVLVKGHGTSLHRAAASAEGTVTAVVPSGSIRASLAELAGMDLRGLGLLAAKNTEQIPIHCAVASFKARDGILSAQSLLLDTDPVLITGEGTIRLDTEAVDLTLHGHPKRMRLIRLRSPLLIHGTLSHPTPAIETGASLAQAAEAVALGVLLTPLASVLAFVDPGLTANSDCAALLASANSASSSAGNEKAAHVPAN